MFNIHYIFALCIGFAVTFAQWSDDPGNPKMLGSGIQPQVHATSDGGVYIAWLTNSNYHVYCPAPTNWTSLRVSIVS